MKRKLVVLAAAMAAAALLTACQVRTPRPVPQITPPVTHAPVTRAPTAGAATPRAVPSAPAGKTASQDTAGARTTLPEEAKSNAAGQ